MTDEVIVPSSGDEPDDIEEIDGIGPGYARALNRASIHTFADLAQYDSAEELRQTLLEQAEVDVPLWKIERADWIGQARAKTAVLLPQADEEMEESEAEAVTEKAVIPSERTWRQHAGFSIFFDYMTDDNGEKAWQTRVWRTRVYHDESGYEVQFPSTTPSLWVDWILEQADLPEGAPLDTTAVETAAETEPADRGVDQLTATQPDERSAFETVEQTRLEVLDVHVSEIGPSSSVPEKQLMAEVRFQIAGPEAEQVAKKQLPYRLEIHLVNLKSGDSNLVASGSGQLRPQVAEYTSQHQFPIPELGRYELHYIVLLLPPGKMVDYYQGPIINIVP